VFDGFVNPALAAGVSLAAVPVLIHLLNRQRHRPMAWAAMRFVLAAYRRTRRRARLEDLLLLLLRTAGVALLALCVARPFLGARSPLAGLTERRRDLVLALDASASTGYRQDVETVFERISARARELLLELDSSRGDRARLVIAGAHPRLVSWRAPEDALSVLATLTEPTHERVDLVALIGEIAGYAEEDAAQDGELEVVYLSDLQRSDFLPEVHSEGAPAAGAAGAPLLAEQLDRLSALGVRVRVEDLGPSASTPPNLTAAALEVRDLPGPLAPTEVRAVVKNQGAAPAAGVRVALEVDGERRPSQLVDVPARSDAEVLFPVVFRTGGDHTLVVRLEADRLPVDDVRAAVVSIPPPARVLLVDGEPALEIEDDEVGYLAAVLEPPPSDDVGQGPAAALFEPQVVERTELAGGGVDLAQFDVVVLANVASLSAETAERLEQRVAAGGALILTVGGQVDVANWNARLYRPDGTGLLPAELGRAVAVADRRSNYYRVRDFDAAHPALRFFADERWRPLLTEVPIYQFLSARPLASPAPVEGTAAGGQPAAPGARVLARLGDEESSPLLIERDYDRGKVFLWLTTIDRAWTRLPESPRTLVPLVHELLRYAAAPHQPARNVPVGAEFAAEVASFPRSLVLATPDGSRTPLAGEPEPVGPGTWRLPPVADTARAGLYAIELEGAERVPFAVQLDAREGDLQRLTGHELTSIHPALVPGGDSEADGADGSRGAEKGELWRLLAAVALAALVAESAWAAWLGYRRRLP
jgi:hypothetical protein